MWDCCDLRCCCSPFLRMTDSGVFPFQVLYHRHGAPMPYHFCKACIEHTFLFCFVQCEVFPRLLTLQGEVNGSTKLIARRNVSTVKFVVAAVITQMIYIENVEWALDLMQLHYIKIPQPEEILYKTVTVNMLLAILGIEMIKKKSVTDKSYVANFTFADPVQSLSLDFVFISQGHGVTHTARHRTAGHSRVPLPPQLQILTRLRNLVHSQHYSPGHTATAHKPARKEKEQNKKTHVHIHTL